jgi:acetyl esterase/lipase
LAVGPVFVITAENNSLRDEGETNARKLKVAGVAMTATRHNGSTISYVS